MRYWDPSDDYRGDNEPVDRQRLKRAKDQLLKVLRKLRRRSKFNVITFSDRVINWKKSIVATSRGNLGQARKFVTGLQANGLTHTDDALEKAFKDPGIDTICLLSDGAPTKQNAPQGAAFQQQILQRVKDLNASRKLRINTFGFDDRGVAPNQPRPNPLPAPIPAGQNELVGFLKKLAEENGGTYHSIK